MHLVVLAAMTAMSVVNAVSGASPSGRDERCEAATVALEYERQANPHDRLWVMALGRAQSMVAENGASATDFPSPEYVDVLRTVEPSGAEWGSWSRAAPDATSLKKFLIAQPSNPALDCGGFRTVAEALGISFNQRKRRFRHRGGTALYPVVLFSMTTPVLNGAGDEAIVSVDLLRADLGNGGEWFLWLKRGPDGVWRVADRSQVAIS